MMAFAKLKRFMDPRVKRGVTPEYVVAFALDIERYLIACGLIGDPVPPVMISGGPQKKNS